MATKKKPSFLYRNSLSLVLIVCFLFCITGQIFTGWHEHNEQLTEHGASQIPLGEYLTSGHFLQVTFENWESEFLQMGMYVLLTISLRQQGSSESKTMEGDEEVDREPDPGRKDAPWPVRKGGAALWLYQSSLSITFILLFLISFLLHFKGSLVDYNEEQLLTGKPVAAWTEYLSASRFWFESFQNWQSEFIAVLSIVVLSIFLRQKGSPESKPVDAPNSETGE
ncbi:MAG TPA: DUF6766 family protein [Cyclobacteriaceae bacterium]|nr:DUF6766 family protein [Cyclobacteriaceae bacterium]